MNLVEELAYQGLTNNMIADVMRVSRSTFYEMLKKPELSDSIHAGRGRRAQEILRDYMRRVADGDLERAEKWLRIYYGGEWCEGEIGGAHSARVQIREIVVEHPVDADGEESI